MRGQAAGPSREKCLIKVGSLQHEGVRAMLIIFESILAERCCLRQGEWDWGLL